MSKIFISIVLPTYNRVDILRKIILPSLEKQKYTNFELIIVDDCSTDLTSEYFASKEWKQEFPRLWARSKIIRNAKNMGSPASRNVGFKKSQGKWIYMVEDDLEIRDENFLQKAEKIIKNHKDEKIGVFVPKREEFISGYYTNRNKKFINMGLISKEIYLDPQAEYSGFVENAQACSFIRADIAKQVKYSVGEFSYFREESDFYERIKKIGYKLYYVGDVLKSYHRMDLVSGGGNRKHSSALLKNEKKFISSHYTFLKRHYKFAGLRIIAFIFVRETKNIANLLKLNFIKNILATLRL